MLVLKRVFLLAKGFCVLILFLLLGLPGSAAEVPVGAQEAALRGLTSFLKAIPKRDLGHFNFSSQKELDEARLGSPFRVYTIDPEKIFGFTSTMSLNEIISPTRLWFFPIISNDEIRTLLTIDLVDGEWRAVAIGSSGLAKQWASVVSVWPTSKGYKHTFVRVFQASADFVVVSDPKEARMVPLESARISLKIERAKAYNPSEIIPALKKAVRDNIEASKSFNRK